MQLPRKMSAQNVMASISRTLGNRESKPAVANEIRFAGDERKDKLYEPKHKQKLVRVLTVVAYVIFVSMAAILLSLYYTFLWDPKDLSARVMRVNKECANIKLSDSLTVPPMSNETQIENVATKSTTDDEELNNVSTPQPKGLLTLLIQSTDMKSVYRKVQSTEKISSSTAMTATTTSSISTKRNTSVNISEEEIL